MISESSPGKFFRGCNVPINSRERRADFRNDLRAKLPNSTAQQLIKGQTGIYGSRDAIRKSYQLGLIADGEKWMDAYKSRTMTSHTYNEETAREVVDAILISCYPLFDALEKKMKTLLS